MADAQNAGAVSESQTAWSCCRQGGRRPSPRPNPYREQASGAPPIETSGGTCPPAG